MAELPFFVKIQQTVSANSTGTLSFNVDPSQKWKFFDWLWSSTGTFRIDAIRLSSGLNLTNALTTNAIGSVFLPKVSDEYHALLKFPIPIELDNNNILSIDVTDTSGSSNVIQVVLSATYQQ